MSSQTTLQSDKIHKSQKKQHPTQIDEEAYESDQLGQSKTKFGLSTPQTDKQYKKYAESINQLPEMPEAAKNIAKQYMENHITVGELKKYENLGKNLMNGIRSMNNATLNPQSRNIETNINRSFSLKSLNNNLSQKQIDKFAFNEEDPQPKMSARIKDIAPDNSSYQEKFNPKKTFQQNSTTSQGGTSNNYINLGSIKGFSKNIIVTSQSNSGAALNQSSQGQNTKLSPLPQKYQHLPNIIKKKMSDAASISFQFNVPPGEKSKKEIKNLEILQSQLRQDVSYLNDHKHQTQSQMQNYQPTILTTGEHGQDELLQATLGLKNIGKSLIHLPQSVQELSQVLANYNAIKQKNVQNIRYEKEEQYFESYLMDNFSQLNEESENNDVGLKLPAISLKQHMNMNGFQSKFLANQSQQLKVQQLSQPFNLSDKMKTLQLLEKDKQPPLINIVPEKLTLVNSKIIQKFGEQILQENLQPTEINQDSARKKPLKGDLDTSKRDITPTKIKNNSKTYEQTEQMKSIDYLLGLATTRQEPSHQRSWMNQERSADRYRDSNGTKHHHAFSLSPINLKTQKQIQNKTLITQIVQSNSISNFSNPTSRQDAVLLIVWFEKILLQIQQEFSGITNEEDRNQQFELLQLVMNICIKELSRQVSVQFSERGLVIQKVFSSYAKLIDLIYSDYKQKRWKIKKDLTDKLDKYIQLQEEQVRNFQNKIINLEATEKTLRADLNECITRIQQQSIIMKKFKKKTYNAQKDFDVAQRKLKYLEKENQDLRKKVQDLGDKFGEEISDFDETDRNRLYLKIDEESQMNELAKRGGDVMDEFYDIDKVQDRDIIKEEDVAIDGRDFEDYLKMIGMQKTTVAETQTDKIIKKHQKIGVQPEKLGILREKETYIDVRMFQNVPKVIQQAIGTDILSNMLSQHDQNLQEDESGILQSDDDEDSESQQSEDDLDFGDKDQQDNEFGPLNIDGYDQRPTTRQEKLLKGEILSEIDEEEMKYLPQYGTDQANDIIDKTNRQTKKKDAKSQIGVDVSLQISGNKNKRRNAQEKKQTQTLMQIYADRIKKRLKGILNSEEIHRLQEMHPNFTKILKNNLIDTGKEIKQMDKELTRKDKQMRFQLKQNKKKEKILKKNEARLDTLEVDNYNFREQMNDQIRSLEDHELSIGDIFRLLQRDSMGKMTIEDLKNKLNLLVDKIATAKNKAQQTLQEDDGVKTFEEMLSGAYNSQDISMINQNDQINQDILAEQMGLNKSNLNFSKDIQYFNQMIDSIKKFNELLTLSNQKVQNKSSMNMSLPQTSQEARRKKAITRFQQFNIGKNRKAQSRRQAQHPSSLLLRKMIDKKQSKIKDIMPRKMMLRVIYQVYQERGYYDFKNQNTNNGNNPVNNGQNQNITQNNLTVPNNNNDKNVTIQSFNQNNNTNQQLSLLEWVYENFMQKYGLKNVAEKKFQQLLGSCILQKESHPRIRLFGRFLEVYDDLAAAEYNRYLEIVELFNQQILNFKIDDEAEITLLPLIEEMRITVGPEEAMKIKHLKGIKEAIDFDRFVEYVIDTYNFIREEKENQIRDIYLAVDVNNDGLMSLNEFAMLMKTVHFKTSTEIKRLFEEYGSIDQDPQNRDMKLMNLEQFTQLCLDKDYFSPKIQHSFCQSTNVEEDFQNLLEKIPDLIECFRNRLLAVNMFNDPESVELLENFQGCMRYPFSERVGWLCYRIVDEIFKKIYLKKCAEMFMPVDIRAFGMKLKPQQGLLNQLPLYLYDTL